LAAQRCNSKVFCSPQTLNITRRIQNERRRLDTLIALAPQLEGPLLRQVLRDTKNLHDAISVFEELVNSSAPRHEPQSMLSRLHVERCRVSAGSLMNDAM
jgi:hypothetical protein